MSGTNLGTILGAAGLACGALALVVALSQPAAVDSSSAPEAATPSEVAALRDSVRDLERRVEQAARPRRATPSSAAAAHVPPDLEERLASLEERVQRSEQVSPPVVRAQQEIATDELRRHALRALRGREAATPEEVAELQRTAVDPSGTVSDRMQALRRLRRAEGGRTREVVIAMAELARTTGESAIRADVFRQLDGVRFDELRQPLLDALRSDPDRKVREEAAETLEGYLDDPSVRAALELAAESDADRKVREQAGESLEGRKRRR